MPLALINHRHADKYRVSRWQPGVERAADNYEQANSLVAIDVNGLVVACFAPVCPVFL